MLMNRFILKLLTSMINDKKLKIAYVLDDGLDVPNGVQQYILSVGEWMQGHGHEVHYIVGETKRRDIKNIHSMSRNIKIKFNGNIGTMPLPVKKVRLRKLLKEENFDILHIQMPYSPFFAHKLIKLAPLETSVVGTFHIAPNNNIVSIANFGLGLWLRSSLNKFDKFLSVSPAAQSFAKKTFKIDSEVSPNVIDYELFNSANKYSDYDDGKLNILFLGRLVPRKGCLQLLKAVNKIKDLDSSFRLIVCGSGPLQNQLNDYVKLNNLSEIVEFKGFVAEKDKLRYYKSADIAVFPSSGGESFGIVLIEAMSSGNTAILAGNNSGYRAVLHDKPDILFDPKNVDELADKLRNMIVNEKYRKAVADWGNTYVKNFDINKVGNELLDIYESSLHKS